MKKQNKIKLEPIINLNTNQPVAWELLFGGPVLPGSLKEWQGWYGQIGDYIRQTIKTISDPGCSVHINLDTDHVYCDVITSHIRELKDLPVALEWTERECRWPSVNSMMEAGSIFSEMQKSCGFQIVLDDFGNGCSFRRLCSISPDIIKIDGKIFQAAKSNSRVLTAVRGCIDMFNRWNMPVVIEWIETKKDLNFARWLEADYGQGCFWSGSSACAA